MIRTALALAERGLRVFPCWPGTKKPRTAHGCLDATTDPLVINDWWGAESALNVAVATGAASKVFVVDVDGVEAEAGLRKLEDLHGALPPTIESITGRAGGRHLWFQHPGDRRLKNTEGRIAPKIDSRGDGGYVLSPPSLHPSGRRYAWSVDSTNTFAEAPGWLLDKITEQRDGNGAVPPTPPSEWRDLVGNGVAEGARDCSAARLAGYLLRRRVDPFVALELVHIWNTTRCSPPLPGADIERIVTSIAGRELKRRRGQPDA
jgi:hypothetical protein